jgi:hypothetical protein
MNHLSEEQLNEYLDHESQEHEEVESHLSTCGECTARLNSLQALFAELDSLPESPLSRDLAVPVMHRVSRPGVLPKWLTLTIVLQAGLALVISVTAIPFIIELTARSMPVLKFPSFAEIFIQLQTQWIMWLEMLSTWQAPAIPAIQIPELSSLAVLFTLAGVSMLWLIGNGLLLRNQIK